MDGRGLRGGGEGGGWWWYFLEAFVKPASGAFDVLSRYCVSRERSSRSSRSYSVTPLFISLRFLPTVRLIYRVGLGAPSVFFFFLGAPTSDPATLLVDGCVVSPPWEFYYQSFLSLLFPSAREYRGAKLMLDSHGKLKVCFKD